MIILRGVDMLICIRLLLMALKADMFILSATLADIRVCKIATF